MANLNRDVAELLTDWAFYAELAGENPFKVRALTAGAWAIQGSTENLADLAREKRLSEISGIGKGLAAGITEFINTGKILEFENLRARFPSGLLEIREVRGLGPKKIAALYSSLGIASLGELEYACRENRLLELKGFGVKTQTAILKQLEEQKVRRGKLLLPQARALAEEWQAALAEASGVRRVEITGDVRRALETADSIDFVVAANPTPDLDHSLESILGTRSESLPQGPREYIHESGVRARVYLLPPEDAAAFTLALLKSSASAEFLASLGASLPQAATEKELFQKLNLPFFPLEVRELAVDTTKNALQATAAAELERLVEAQDIRGIFHAHTNASDGSHSLEEMVEACQKAGLSYLGISEHSESAGYAGGLDAQKILKQRTEVAKLNAKLTGFRIFHGIESDIRKNGDLDYPVEVLRDFDFVIASLHGGLSQPGPEITDRVCRALENPFTTWLGHPTGRLLLGRAGADLDMEKVITTAKTNGKSFELNANPYRLDLDWRWFPRLRAENLSLGIFPDAHSCEGIADFHYGITMARKGGMRKRDIVNTKNLVEISQWLADQRRA